MGKEKKWEKKGCEMCMGKKGFLQSKNGSMIIKGVQGEGRGWRGIKELQKSKNGCRIGVKKI